MGMRPNWFLALPVRAPWFPAALGEVPPRVRVFHPDDLHLTVAFLGGCGDLAARRAWELAEGHPGPAGLTATVARVAAMGNPKRPSALSALLDVGHDEVAAFLAEHRDGWLAAAGARPARHGPLPHCTLARPQRRASDAQRQAAIAWGTDLALAGRPLHLGPLTLYTWAEDRRQRLFREVAVAG
jgi:2'-5' RNA ligase